MPMTNMETGDPVNQRLVLMDSLLGEAPFFFFFFSISKRLRKNLKVQFFLNPAPHKSRSRTGEQH